MIKAEKMHSMESNSHIEKVGPDGVSGWLYAVNNYSHRLSVEVLIDDMSVAKVTADQFRPDLYALGVGDGRCGFWFNFPDAYFDGAEHVVMLQVAESSKLLLQEPISVKFPNKPLSRKVLGNFERVDADRNVSGWATSEMGETVSVELQVNGITVVQKAAELIRPDLIVSGIGTGRSGFKLGIPWHAIDSFDSEVNVIVEGKILPGSPKRLKLANSVKIWIESVRHGKLHIKMQGWHGKPLTGDILVDGVPAGSVTLSQGIKNGHKEGFYRGSWDIPESLQDGQPHLYCFEILNSNTVARSDSVLLSYPAFNIHVDHADYQSITGWVFRTDHAAPLVLEVYANGEFVAFVEASIDRMDVMNAASHKSAKCGFHLDLDRLECGSGTILTLLDKETRVVVAEVSIADSYSTLTGVANKLKHDNASLSHAELRSVLVPFANMSSSKANFSFVKLPKKRTQASISGVDVIIPVYGGSIETAECLESVLESRNETPSRIIVVNDCSPDPLINDLLDTLERRGNRDLIIVRRTSNGGFSESVNIGMTIAKNRHVVLLNADTVVQHGWLDKLMAAAASDPTIGTVTPFSNNGEIVTLPYQCKSLAINETELAREVDLMAARCNPRVTLDIPVAIGFCMFIRRQCIDEIGLFDAALWGRGYGEEVDFCLKARAHGWRHVVAADAFVVHRGSVSFGDEKLERIKDSARKISERYPFYDQLIQRFIAQDTIGPARRKVNIALISGALPEDRILHVSHGFGGGTEKYLRDLSAIHAQSGQVPLVLRFDSAGRAELEVDLEKSSLAGFFSDHHKETYKSSEQAELQTDIARLGIKRVHLHAPFGLHVSFLDWLTSTFPFDVTVHDYAWICPRVTLTQSGGRYCGEPTVQDCDRCISVHGAHPGLRGAFEESQSRTALYRQTMSTTIGRAETVFAGVDDVVKRLESHGIGANFHVVPHPEPVQDPAMAVRTATRSDAGTVRVALFGGISDIKGLHQLIACAKHAQDNRLPLSFIVFGFTMNDEAVSNFENITVTGRYDEDELDLIVQEHGPHISFFPNQWPETFSYTLSHSLRLGLWPVVTDLGALAERVKVTGFGEIVPYDSSPAVFCQRLLAAGFRGQGPDLQSNGLRNEG